MIFSVLLFFSLPFLYLLHRLQIFSFFISSFHHFLLSLNSLSFYNYVVLYMNIPTTFLFCCMRQRFTFSSIFLFLTSLSFVASVIKPHSHILSISSFTLEYQFHFIFRLLAFEPTNSR
jgi:sensor histidine kinase YesM